VEDILCLGLARRGGGRFPLSLSTYPFGANGRLNENKSINQSTPRSKLFERQAGRNTWSLTKHSAFDIDADSIVHVSATDKATSKDQPIAIYSGWRSAVYLKRIRKRETDHCWLCDGIGQNQHRMSRAHVLMNCRNPKVMAARAEAWEGKNPGSVRRLLADPRWEKRFVRFLELSGVGRTLADGTDEESAYAARMDTWIAWETEDAAEVESLAPRGDG
jgi:hypothetical protein